MVDLFAGTADTLGLLESTGKTAGFFRPLSEGLLLQESFAKSAGFARSVSDAFLFVETENPGRSFALVNADSLSLLEAFGIKPIPPPPTPTLTFGAGLPVLFPGSPKMSAMVQPTSFQLQMANSDRNLVNGAAATIGLFSNNVVPTQNSNLSDFTECDYDGYAGKSTTLGLNFIDSDGRFACLQTVQFDSVPGAGTLNVVYGVMMSNSLGLVAAGQLAPPANMGGLAQSLPLEVMLKDGVLSLSRLP